MEKSVNIEEFLAKIKKPSEDARRLHPFYRGKLEVTPKCRIKDSSYRQV
jgi:malate dehydrogenase (oxaloacetate-decarboxylating)